MKRNGPEPISSGTFLSAGVSAIRFGMMKGTLAEGFDSEATTRP